MADHNNAQAGSLPSTPDPALRTLDRLTGRWQITGAMFNGTTTFEWLEGGFYFVQRSSAEHDGRRFSAAEYIGYDEDTRTLRSHMMDSGDQKSWGSFTEPEMLRSPSLLKKL